MAADLRIHVSNRPGQLAGIAEALGAAGINIEGFCAAPADGGGFVHVLVETADAARHALEHEGFTVSAERQAIVLPGVQDRPGYLGELTRRLADTGVNIEAAYLATHTRIVFGVDDIDAARQAL